MDADEPEVLDHEEEIEEDDDEPMVPPPRRHHITAAEKERYALEASRQLDQIMREKARTKKRRNAFLLSQSDLFRHFLNEGGPPKNVNDINALLKSPSLSSSSLASSSLSHYHHHVG